ncbi:hypothetical protein [Sphingomonas sp.]|uniref:hypothetical protein n=1 Tax=Sphingomonas sp. TaxID=28214 RepID=UPI001B0CF69B|nr:hypothetical protein [Sphingomonas sp.]MBO9712635.1 hypothetical protein [Sphingomonas sp.]
MREPDIRTRVLGSAPVFLGSWAMAIVAFILWMQRGDAWPLLIGFGLLVAAATKADRQMQAYWRWQVEWNQMAGTPPRRKRPLMWAGSIVLGLLLFSLLGHAAQHGGGQAVVGVLMLLAAPLLLFAGLAKLWAWARRRRRGGSARDGVVAVCIRRPLIPVPTLRDAYRGLPDHCRQVLGPVE